MTGTVQKSILEAYLWMFAGLLLTGLTSLCFFRFGWMYTILMNFPAAMWLLPVIQIGIAISFSFMMAKASPMTLKIMFLAYAFTMGISLSSLFYVYTEGTIYVAFFVSALYFGCLALIGFTTKKDLSKFGSIALAALLALIISQVVMMLFRIAMPARLLSVIGLIIFAGLTAWDVQRLNTTMLYAQGQPLQQQKYAIYFALELYLDFINIFMYVLQLIGMGSNNRR